MEPDDFARLVVWVATRNELSCLLMLSIMAELGWSPASPLHAEDEDRHETIKRACRDFAQTARATGAGRSFMMRRAARLEGRLVRSKSLVVKSSSASPSVSVQLERAADDRPRRLGQVVAI